MTVVLCNVLVSIGGFAADNSLSSTAFPLLSGDSWTFVKEGSSDTYLETVDNGTFLVNSVQTKRIQHSDGSQMYLTNDTSGVREHREFIPAENSTPAATVTFSPAFQHSLAEMTVGQVINSFGTATFDYGVYGVYDLTYDGSSMFEATETVVVPFGTFQTGRIHAVMTFTGWVGPTYINLTVEEILWVAENIGVVKQIFDSNTYVLTDTNFTPDPFSFPSQTGVDTQSTIVSDPISVSDISAPAAVSVQGGEYSIDGGGYTSNLGFVTNGQIVRVRLVSSSNPGVSTTAVLNIGGTAASFTVTTASSLILYADLGASGIWKYNGTSWSPLAPENPEQIVASGSDLYADLGASGIWKCNGTSWTFLAPENPEQLAVSGSTLYADLGSYGIWKYGGTSWTFLAPENPELIVASGSDLYADLGSYGIWKYNGTGWTFLAPENPEQLAVSGSTLYADLGAFGIWKHDGTSWSKLAPENPEQIVASGSELYVDFRLPTVSGNMTAPLGLSLPQRTRNR